MSKIFNKIVFSNIPPTDTNVLWIYPLDSKHYDFRLYTTVLLDNYIAVKKWTSIGVTDINKTDLTTDFWYIGFVDNYDNIKLDNLEKKDVYFHTININPGTTQENIAIVIPKNYKINSIYKSELLNGVYVQSKEDLGLFYYKKDISIDNIIYSVYGILYNSQEFPYQITVNVTRDLDILDFIVLTTGFSIDKVMSLKAVTDNIDALSQSKVDKELGKGLSTNDFTTALKNKLESLLNFDSTDILNSIYRIEKLIDTLLTADTSYAIESFNEVIRFLDGIKDNHNLSGIIASIEQLLAKKIDKTSLSKVATSGNYNDLINKPITVTEQIVSDWGFTKNTGTYIKPYNGIPKKDLEDSVKSSLDKADTALLSYEEEYKGTVTGVKINGQTKSPSLGIVDLGAVITKHLDISGKQDKLSSGTNIKTINEESILGGGNIDLLPTTGGTMQGNIDMNGYKVLNATLPVVDVLPVSAYDGQQVVYQGIVYTFNDGIWLSAVSDLVGHTGETHEENFIYQPSAADLSIKDGFADIKRIKGNTIVWNQVLRNFKADRASTLNENGIIKITPDDSYHRYKALNGKGFKSIAGHKYYQTIIIKSDGSNLVGFANYGLDLINSNLSTIKAGTSSLEWVKLSVLVTENVSNNVLVQVYSTQGTEYYIRENSFMLFDLTQMFGAGNEPTLEEFEAMFPNDYYEYNEGELRSLSNAVGIKSVGFNQFDGEKAKVLKGQKYYLGGDYENIGFKNGGEIEPFDIPSNRLYVPLDNGYIYATGSNICISLSHTGYRNGEYEPYKEHITLFDDNKAISQLTGKLNGEGESVTIFPDGLRSAGNVFDEITSDGKAIKRIGAVDMGTFKWSKYDINESKYVFSAVRPSYIKTFQSTEKANVLMIKYPTVDWHNLFNDNVKYGFAVSGLFLRLGDNSFTDVTTLKQSLQGQILYYELAEPEVYELDNDINTRYEAYDFGTEEVLYEGDANPNIPIKADIEYGFNAVDMIRSNYNEIQSLKETISQMTLALTALISQGDSTLN